MDQRQHKLKKRKMLQMYYGKGTSVLTFLDFEFSLLHNHEEIINSTEEQILR